MRILIAPDSFKGSVTSKKAADAIERAIQEMDSSIETVICPMADGGEGTVEAILAVTGGEMINCKVFDPLGREIVASYGWLEQDKTAIIETASASGLPLLEQSELDPAQASTYGTGQLVEDALLRGAKKIILGLGGSATIDAGTGFFQALGVKFLDDEKNVLINIGGQLSKVSSIDLTGLLPELLTVDFLVASDVSNVLLGKEGAITVFGPQKGVMKQQVPLYEDGMRKFSEVTAKETNSNKATEPGSGAAGGMGFLLKALLDVEFRNGLELLGEFIQLENQVKIADIVLTGEGRIDGQSLYGKVPVGIGRMAKKYNVPVIAFAGSIGPGIDSLEKEGILAVMPIQNGPLSTEDSMMNGELLLYQAAKRLLKVLLIGKKSM